MMEDPVICVVGLGYVGLPLAVAFGRTDFVAYGFDVNSQKIQELQKGFDSMQEVSNEELASTRLTYSNDPSTIGKANFIIVAVPTPVDKAHKPDLCFIESASRMVGQNLTKDSVVVFESTVYPGVTEEICIPLIEKESGLQCGIDWKIGYSPERINPGDKEHTLDKIVKVVSGMDDTSLETIARVYSAVCKAGVYKAANIKTAEAAKVIENVQRDLNIAMINELSLIFDRMGIVTKDVLNAADTKWNFHKYQPGLVGGHCIGVDPYYLTYRAEQLGYFPQVILAGRRINDSMPIHVAEMMVKGLIKAGKYVKGAKVLVMGLTFKENVKDIRNSKAREVIEALRSYGVTVFGYDPLLSADDVRHEFDASFLTDPSSSAPFDGLILVVPHRPFLSLSLDQLTSWMTSPPVLVDVQGVHHKQASSFKDLIYHCL